MFPMVWRHGQFTFPYTSLLLLVGYTAMKKMCRRFSNNPLLQSCTRYNLSNDMTRTGAGCYKAQGNPSTFPATCPVFFSLFP